MASNSRARTPLHQKLMLARNPPTCLTFLFSGALGCRQSWLLTRGAFKWRLPGLYYLQRGAIRVLHILQPSSCKQPPTVALLRLNRACAPTTKLWTCHSISSRLQVGIGTRLRPTVRSVHGGSTHPNFDRYVAGRPRQHQSWSNSPDTDNDNKHADWCPQPPHRSASDQTHRVQGTAAEGWLVEPRCGERQAHT